MFADITSIADSSKISYFFMLTIDVGKWSHHHKQDRLIVANCTVKSVFMFFLVSPLYIFLLCKHFEQRLVICAVRLLILKHSNNKGFLHFVHCFFSIFINHQAHEKYHLVTKNKMDNPTFFDEEDISMVNQDEDDDGYYKTPDTSRVETSFIEPGATQATSTLRLRQKVKRDKMNALYRHLNVTANPDLIHLDRFRLTKDRKK